MTARLIRAAAALALGGAALGDVPTSAAAPPPVEALRAAAAQANAIEQGPLLVRLAEAHLDALAIDASDTTALVGVPTAETRRRVASAAASALSACRDAADALRTGIRTIEQDDGYPDDESLRRRRSELAVEYLEFRQSYALARAALLAAAVAPDDAAARRFANLAVQSLDGLDARAPALLARRDAHRGLARLTLGEADAAANTLRTATNAGRAANDTTLARTIVEAAVGRALALAAAGDPEGADGALAGASGGAPFVDASGAANPAWRVALADAHVRVALIGVENGPSRTARDRAWRRAEAAYVDLLRDGVEGVAPGALRSLVYAKCRAAAERVSAGAASTPPLFVAAEATRLAGSDETIDEAAGLAEGLLDSGVAGPAAPEVLWEAGRILLAHVARDDTPASRAQRDRRRALMALVRLARDWPDWPQSTEALRAACAAGAALRRAGALEDADSTDAYRHALRLTLSRLPEAERPRWRVELTHVLGLDHPDVPALLDAVPTESDMAPFARTLEAALAHRVFRSASPTATSRGANALLERIEAARGVVDRAATAPRARLRRPLDFFEVEARLTLGQTESAAEVALAMPRGDPLTRAALNQTRRDLRQRLDDLIRRDEFDDAGPIGALLMNVCARLSQGDDGADVASDLAWATLAAGSAGDAAERFEELIARRGRRATLLRGLALSLWRSGRPAEAFAVYRDAAAALEARGVRDDLFWTAWSRMLQILAEQNDRGQRTEEIRRGVARLRAIDASLGGSPHRERIERVEGSLTRPQQEEPMDEPTSAGAGGG